MIKKQKTQSSHYLKNGRKRETVRPWLQTRTIASILNCLVKAKQKHNEECRRTIIVVRLSLATEFPRKKTRQNEFFFNPSHRPSFPPSLSLRRDCLSTKRFFLVDWRKHQHKKRWNSALWLKICPCCCFYKWWLRKSTIQYQVRLETLKKLFLKRP